MNDNSSQHINADYWAGDTLGEINLHQQWHRPSGYNLCFNMHKRNPFVFAPTTIDYFMSINWSKI